MSNSTANAEVVQITKTLTTDEARDLTRSTRAIVNAECHKPEFVIAKATTTERRVCVKDFNAGIPSDPVERAAYFASL